MELKRDDTKMLQGFAILSMVCLHLFCRTGADVFGKPLIWVNETTPLVYYLGFLSEICVPLYAFCSGYGLMKSFAKTPKPGAYYKATGKRLLRLMITFWIVCLLFSGLGLFFDRSGAIPGSLPTFIGNMTGLRVTYNGAWWFLTSYIYLSLISWPFLALVDRMKLRRRDALTIVSLALCAALYTAYFLANKRGIFAETGAPIRDYILTQAGNLIHILPAWLIGAVFAGTDLIDRLVKRVLPKEKPRFVVFLLATLALAAVLCFLNKGLLMYLFTFYVVIAFKQLVKAKWLRTCFLFLGKHSTVTWLTHFFFYACLFTGLVQLAVYPVLMLLFMMALCIITSYIVQLPANALSKALKLS